MKYIVLFVLFSCFILSCTCNQESDDFYKAYIYNIKMILYVSVTLIGIIIAVIMLGYIIMHIIEEVLSSYQTRFYRNCSAD